MHALRTDIRGDAFDVMPRLPAESFDSLITSPPYFQKLAYADLGPDQFGLGAFAAYCEKLGQLVTQTSRLLKPGGALILNMGDTWNNKGPIRAFIGDMHANAPLHRRRQLEPGAPEKSQLPVVAILHELIANDPLLYVRDTWYWHKPAGRPTNSDRPPNDVEHLLYVRKHDHPRGLGRPSALYWDAQHVPSRVFYYQPARAAAGHPCPMPPDLLRRLMLAVTPVDGHTLDPFAGLGTLADVANPANRHATCIDLASYGPG